MVDIGGPFCKVSFERVNINSPVQLKEFLLSQGWEPTQWTEKGSPQITEDSFGSIKGGLGQLLADRAALKHRLGMLFNISKGGELKGWINTVRDDGRLEAGGIPQGTPTGRYRHIGVVNVPKADEKIPYGPQFRSLFIPKPGYKFMGVDAAALEARIEAHYCYIMPGGKEHAAALLEGDIHQRTADALGITRNHAKTVKYAVTYGARPKKLSKTLDCSLKEAEKIYDGFWKANPALSALYEAAERAHKSRGFLIGLDGRKLLIREDHKLVNTLFQSGGSIVVKTATAYLVNFTRNMDARQVMHFHDEMSYEFHPKHEKEICELARMAFRKAGEFWELNVPIEGDPKVGMSWRDVH